MRDDATQAPRRAYPSQRAAAPRRTRSRGHREAAAPWRPRAILQHPAPRAAFAASPQEHSLKLTPARWPRPGNRPGIRPGSPVPICRAAVHSRGHDWCPGRPNPRCSRYPAAHRCSWLSRRAWRAAIRPATRIRRQAGRRPPARPVTAGLAVGEDVDLTARAGDAHEPGHRGRSAAGRERPGSPARRPVLISTARPLASRQLARDRSVTSRLAARGSNP